MTNETDNHQAEATELADIDRARSDDESNRQANPLALSTDDYRRGAEHIQQLANGSDRVPSWMTAERASHPAAGKHVNTSQMSARSSRQNTAPESIATAEKNAPAKYR